MEKVIKQKKQDTNVNQKSKMKKKKNNKSIEIKTEKINVNESDNENENNNNNNNNNENLNESDNNNIDTERTLSNNQYANQAIPKPPKSTKRRILSHLVPLIKPKSFIFDNARILSEFIPLVPQFPTSDTNFISSHTCKRLNTFQCDNSFNFVTQCNEDNFSRCPLQNLLLDCRRTISYFRFQKYIGGRALDMSTFGMKSKCVKIKKRRKRQGAACLRTFCHPSRTSYIILVPDGKGRSYFKHCVKL